MSLPLRFLSLTHGLYYVITGFWPVISIRTFQWVTGPKGELWLVKTAGLLIGVIGSVLTLSGIRRRVQPEIPVLAVGSALSLAGIDVVYWKRGRLAPIYLLDALGEVTLSAGWIVAWMARPRKS